MWALKRRSRPELYETFMQKKEKILATGIDFMNCAELALNPNNIGNYEGESRIWRVRGIFRPSGAGI